MLIQCTQKLLKQLKKEPVSISANNPLYSWHATARIYDGQETLIFVNDLSRITIILRGIRQERLEEIDRYFMRALHEYCQVEHIPEAIINKFMESMGTIYYTTTSDRAMVARLDRIALEGEFNYAYHEGRDAYFLVELSRFINHSVMMDYHGDTYIKPVEKLREIIEETFWPRDRMPDDLENDCEHCGQKKARMHITMSDDSLLNLCSDCFNQMVAKEMDIELNPFEQKKILFTNRRGDNFTFEISRFVLPVLISYEAIEVRDDQEPGRMIKEMDAMPCDEGKLWRRFCQKITRYIEKDYLTYSPKKRGMEISEENVGGYLRWNDTRGGQLHDVVIDGRSYTWEAFGRLLNGYEGYQFKLTLLDPSEDMTR